jgi:hypothetical protein
MPGTTGDGAEAGDEGGRCDGPADAAGWDGAAEGAG